VLFRSAFQIWVTAECAEKKHAIFQCNERDDLSEEADCALKELLGIQSKRELDTDPEAAARFDALRTDFELREFAR
jgi:hypothetical protein